MNTLWAVDWQSQLLTEIQQRGFDSVEKFLNAFPTIGYQQFAKELGVAAVQIKALQFQEALQNGHLREAAIDALIRELHEHLPKGWKRGIHWKLNTGMAFGLWKAALPPQSIIPLIEEISIQVENALKAASPPEGWLPLDRHDQYIQKAFHEGWPAEIK